jgi:hypothetical protein
VGAYRLKPPNELEFSPGQLLQAIDENRWIVIDELNRADIDKAIGQFFTVLSGQPVVLPYIEDQEGELLPPAIVPPGKESPPNSHAHHVSDNWRVIATLNDRDRDLLFDMSEALIRRFAVIEVGPPSKERWAELLAARAATGRADLDRALSALSQLQGRPLGPAILIDCAAYLRSRLVVASETGEVIEAPELVDEALDMFIRPHLVNVTATEKTTLDAYLRKVRGDVIEGTPAAATPSEGELVSDATDDEDLG